MPADPARATKPDASASAQGGGGEVWAVRDRVTAGARAQGARARRGRGRDRRARARGDGAERPRGARACRASSRSARSRRPAATWCASSSRGRASTTSCDDDERAPLVEPLASASDQLTVVHRAGLLHGDIKPANIIVGAGRARHARRPRPRRALARGRHAPAAGSRRSTPRPSSSRASRSRSAPRSTRSARRSARRSRGAATSCPEATRASLAKVARAGDARRRPRRGGRASTSSRARSAAPRASRPTARRRAAVAGPRPRAPTAQALVETARRSAPGQSLAHRGPARLGAHDARAPARVDARRRGAQVAMIRAAGGGLSLREAVDLELAAARAALQGAPASDLTRASSTTRATSIEDASSASAARVGRGGARIVAVGVAPRSSRGLARTGRVTAFEVPAARRASRRTELVAARRCRRSPTPCGPTSSPARRAGGRARCAPFREARSVTARSSRPRRVDAVLGDAQPVPRAALVGEPRRRPRRASSASLDTGPLRRGRARSSTSSAQPQRRRASASAWRIARARVALGRGDGTDASRELDAVEARRRRRARCRARLAGRRARARTFGPGEYAEAAELRERRRAATGADATRSPPTPSASRGVALVFTGEDALPARTLERAVALARASGDRASRPSPSARSPSPTSAPVARRGPRGLRGLARRRRGGARRGDRRDHPPEPRRPRADRGRPRAAPLEHLEAAVDMGRRTGSDGRRARRRS